MTALPAKRKLKIGEYELFIAIRKVKTIVRNPFGIRVIAIRKIKTIVRNPVRRYSI